MSGRPAVLGVTGGIAAGKSAVMATLAGLGAETIDADVVYRDLAQPGAPLLDRLRDHFGGDIIGRDGHLDRKALGAIVFSNATKLAELDALTHPAVRAEIDARVAASSARVVAVEAVKLIESGHAATCDQVWLVVADRNAQLARLMARNGLSLKEAERRLVAQPDETARRLVADRILDNSGTLDELRRSVAAYWAALPRAENRPRP